MSLKFDEKKHEYTSNKKKLISVTKLVHSYTNDFDKTLILDKMFESSPSEIYLGKSRKYIGMTKEQISTMWKINQESKSAYGTFIHEKAEDIGNGIEVDIKMPEINQVKAFFKREGYEIIEQELRVYSEELGVAGTVDLLLKKDDMYYIGDWKTCVGKDLEKREDRYQKFMKEPVSNIPDLQFWIYSMQMSCYRYIIEHNQNNGAKTQNASSGRLDRKKPDMKFGGQFIIHLIGSQDDLKDKNGKRVIYPEMVRISYKKIDTPYMESEIKSIMEDIE